MDQKFQDEREKEETLTTPGVFDKYQTGGKICNAVLEKVIAKSVVGANIAEVCAFGDAELNGELQKVYNKKGIEKGISFPTCLSSNSMCGHYSPLKSESTLLVQGDVLKIQLGVHVDGFISLVAHTIVVGTEIVEGRNADVILAAYKGIQAAYRLLKAGGTNTSVTEAISKISTSYGCTPVEGVLSHDLKRHFIDGNKVIINRETAEQHVEEQEFQVNDVFALDVIVATGEGKTKESDFRTTVYKRALERQYQLKTKHGRAFMAEIIEKYPTLCFSTRIFEDEITAKLAVQECSKHELLNAYPVLVLPNEIVAQFSITVAILGTSTIALTGLPLAEEKHKTDKKIEDEDLVKLLQSSMDKDAQKKSKKSKPTKEQIVEKPTA